MLLAVNMIVKNEAANLPAALASVRGLADEVVVYDTGSSDGTVGIARAAGARVVEGYWDDDFARARNAALDATSAEWVFQLDADERWQGDAAALRRLLPRAGAGVAFNALIRNRGGDPMTGDFDYRRIRVFRGEGVRWERAIHEQPRGAGARLVREIPVDVGYALHEGLVDPAVLQAKGLRNTQVAQAELDRLVAAGCQDVAVLAPVLFDLGRSLALSGRAQQAVDAMETLRELAPGTPHYALATDYLARLLLSAHQDHEAVLLLSEQLRQAGADDRYCDWLAAQALYRMEAVPEALSLLRGIDRLEDPVGIVYPLGAVRELEAMAAALVGERARARATLVESMAAHGRIEGRGPLLLRLWAGEPADRLAARLLDHGREHLRGLAEELELAGGADVSRALRAA